MKHFSFVAENVEPISQNSRTRARLARLRNDLTHWHNLKYLVPAPQLPRAPLILGDLEAKVFYIHRKPDYKDADNISKPLWDSLNNHAYIDDEQIRYLETLKIDLNTPDIFSLDITNIETHDLQQLLDFMSDITKERMLYVAVSEYESQNVRF